MGTSNNAVKPESPDEVVAFLNQRPYLDFDLIAEMADAGFQFVGTTMGWTRSDLNDWPELATSDKKRIKNWLNQGLSLVSVANRGHAFSLDFDNLKACLAKGFKLEWIDDYFIADSPSGGIHAHGLADDVTDGLPGIIAVYEVKDDASTPKIFEFKLHHQSVAAPTAPRIGQRKKADGIYKPRKWHGIPRKGVDPEFLIWLESVTTIKKKQVKGKPKETDFHPEFEMNDFIENEECVEFASGYLDGVWTVVVEECPHCGREADKSTLAHGVTKFFFSAPSYGFICHACGVNTREEHETLMAKENVSYEPWKWLMYLQDDPELEMKVLSKKLAIEDVTNEPDRPAPIVVEDDEPEHEPTVVPTAAANLKYPELRFPYEALPKGQLKRLTDKACEGGLNPGLVVPSILALASSVPFADRMEGARINIFVTLLAMVGAGKDTAIDRAQAVLGMEDSGFTVSYAPSGERSIAQLIGDKPGGKGEPRVSGPETKIILTYELEDTLNKSKGETSSVLQAMQHFYDHNRKMYSDSKQRIMQNVDCRLSWLTGLPVGDSEIDEDDYRRAFGESSTHGLSSRMLFGFAEERFDRRKSRKWSVPRESYEFVMPTTSEVEYIGEITSTRVDTLITRLQTHVVEGFAPGIAAQYEAWTPKKDISGRDTYHILKVAILTSLVNMHKLIEQDDWDFAVAFMNWQHEIRMAFSPGRAKRTTQGEFNDTIVRELEKRTARMRLDPTETRTQKIAGRGDMKRCFFRWKGLANDGKWHLKGLDVKRTIQSLVDGGTLIYLVTGNPDDIRTLETDENWVRLVRGSSLGKEVKDGKEIINAA